MWNALTGISVTIVISTIVILTILTILTILIFLTLLLHRQEWSSRLSSSSQEMMAMNSLERQSATVSLTIIYIVKFDIDSKIGDGVGGILRHMCTLWRNNR